MRSKLLKLMGYGTVGLALAGICLSLILAVRHGEAFAGTNAYGLAIPVYPALAIFVVAAVAGAVWVFRRLRAALRRPRLD